jgi:quercetin dioxygenase-like cupin family protein
MFAARKQFAVLNLLALCVICTATLAAQEQQVGITEFDLVRTVNILQEPRHRSVHKDGNLHLLDVQINPGDTTLPHTHDSAILYTFISNGEGLLNGRVSSITTYVDEHYTHRVSNEGPGLFRIIAMANYGDAYTGVVQPAAGLVIAPQLENAWFRSFRLELAAGETSAKMTHAYPAAIVQVTDGLLYVHRADGVSTELQSVGDWDWRAARQEYQIQNKSDKPVTVVINEGLR